MSTTRTAIHPFAKSRPTRIRQTSLLLTPTTTTIYVPYLQRRFAALGGDIRQATIAHLDDLAKRYALVVNCTGVGAHDLVDDPEVYPIRGQVIRVQRPPDMGPTIVDVHTETDDLTISCLDATIAS
ncbi:hypothetical protein C2W62_47590 [Candidatus Entotheonella serta]|nr:hypothetical protein C2W62_47590 [Candidatus Entotheonella serta]